MTLARIDVPTQGPGLYEITQQAGRLVEGLGDGLLTLFVRHTTASLLVQENADPDVQVDLKAFFERLVPNSDHSDMDWVTHRLEGPDDMPGHIKAALLPTSLSIPVSGGRLLLGRWQGIYLVEHRDNPTRREVACQIL